MPRVCVNGDRTTAAILDAGANRAAHKCGTQEGEQRRNKPAKHDRSAHHPETDR